MNRQNTLKILQYNVHKSKDKVMASLLRDPRIHEFDILAIQEPWRNPFTATTHHPAKDKFHLCYPPGDEEGPARVCFFINKTMDHTKWRYEESTRDLCTIIIDPGAEHQGEPRLAIHNIYNPPKAANNRRSTLPSTRRALDKHRTTEQILLGDFNLHHPLWGGQDVMVTDPEPEDLIDIMEEFALHSTLLPGTVAYEEGRSQSTSDLCLMTIDLVDNVVRSEVNRDLDHDSDHLPISIELDLTVKRLESRPRKNWKRLDQKTYENALKNALPPLRKPSTKAALDTYVEEVTTAIQSAIDKALPHACPSIHSREGWTEECKVVLAEIKRLKREHSRCHTEESWEAYRTARNQKARTIRKALRKAHRDRIEKAAESPEAFMEAGEVGEDKTQSTTQGYTGNTKPRHETRIGRSSRQS